MDQFTTPKLPKGRGVWFSRTADSGDIGHSKLTYDASAESGLGQSQSCTAIDGFMRENPPSSTPCSDVDALHHLTDMVGQLGAQIGESIVSKLMSAGVVNMNSEPQPSCVTQNSRGDSDRHDPSHLTVHVRPDRVLQTYRGDHTDKCSIRDWIDLTRMHLRKQDIPTCGQGEEIMCHLMGKAKDVVQIALRSDPSLDVTKNPELIYDVLLHYFSETPSCLPLADFYATLPRHRENPVDYWIRLNKAADLALEGQRKRGKQTESINDEVALMFVKHCPDPELSCILKCKPAREWTSRDVQLRIDDYQRELRAASRATGVPQLRSQVAAISPELPIPVSPGLAAYEPCYSPPSSLLSPSFLQSQHHSSCQSPAVSCQGGLQDTRSKDSVPVVTQHIQQSEERLLTRMVDMFQQMMERMQQRNTFHPTRGGRFQRAPREQSNRVAGCKVCNDSSHTTTSHCMSERLCFVCFAPGHTKLNCPMKNPSQSQSEGN